MEPKFTVLLNSLAVIIIGVVAVGILPTHTGTFDFWERYVLSCSPAINFMKDKLDKGKHRILIISGSITFAIGVTFWLFFPDSPANAWFLTPEERRLAVLRIKVNPIGGQIERGRLDQYVPWFLSSYNVSSPDRHCRFMEMVLDRKMWMFILLTTLS